MIQRVQSIWLLLASIAILSLLFLPVVTREMGAEQYQVTGLGVFKTTAGVKSKVEASLPLTITILVTAAACIFSIFNFRNRTNQKRAVMVSIVMVMAVAFWSSRSAQNIPGGINDVTYGAGVFVPVAAIAFCVMALRGISKDEKLIRSADRLR